MSNSTNTDHGQMKGKCKLTKKCLKVVRFSLGRIDQCCADDVSINMFI